MEEQMDDGLFHHDYHSEDNLKESFDSLIKRAERAITENKAKKKPRKKINVMGGINAFGIWVEKNIFRMKGKDKNV